MKLQQGTAISAHSFQLCLRQLMGLFLLAVSALSIVQEPPVADLTATELEALQVSKLKPDNLVKPRVSIDLLRKGGTDLTGIVMHQVDLERYGKLGNGDSGYFYHYGRYNSYCKS